MKVTKSELVALMRHAAECIEANDSYEGWIRWTFGEGADFEAFGVYRFGNLEGQGSVRIIDQEPTEEAQP